VKKLLVILLRISCLPAITAAVLITCFVLRARMVLGYWPEPYRPDPSAVGWPALLYLATYAYIFHVFSLLVVLVLALMHSVINDVTRRDWIWLGSWMLAVFWLQWIGNWPPFLFIEWLLD
jgi:hypothetical protein